MQNFSTFEVVELNFNEMSDIDAGGVVATTMRVVGGLLIAAGEVLNYFGL